MRKLILIVLIFITACSGLAPGQPGVHQASAPAFRVRTHPDGPLFVGDQVSFEVFNPSTAQTSAESVRIMLDGKTLAEERFESFGMGGRSQATFYWVWDTRGLAPASYTLTFFLLPGSTTWNEKVDLHPASGLPYPEPEARWETVETDCCIIHTISETDAARDLEALKLMVATQAADVERRMGAKFAKKIPITFLPRVLGQGGFTADEIIVSYLQQDYAGSSIQQITHHELVHLMDNQLDGKLRPSILQEGLAVYLSDGHFKVEPILPRAAALLDLGWYIPLRRLADSFYLSPHEIGYAEAAALINYLVITYGWDNFNSFYREIESVPSNSTADALDAALQAHFTITLDQLEERFTTFLRSETTNDATRTDLRLTVAFYDAVRRYQYELDPSAYFLNVWLPDISKMRRLNIVADVLRHPNSLINKQIETLLVSGDADLRAYHYTAAEAKIHTVNLLLDLMKQPEN